jgi:tRNA dimethylallyltransferase
LSNKFLVVIVGPTAVGKTSIAIELAKHFQTEIVSADSRQFFREMSIGTAKPSEAELNSVKHHLINSRSIHDEYNVGMFEVDALKSLDKIFKKHDVAILCGGSGMYIDVIKNGMDNLPEKDLKLRSELIKEFHEKGIEVLQDKLMRLDKNFYNEVDRQNPHRMIRAIEICMMTGKKYSDLRKKVKQERPFNTITIGIEDEREMVYTKINLRVDQMLKNGLLEEARSLYAFRHLNALQTVGYRELFLFFENQLTKLQAINLIKQHTRNYAKRQWTWFRKDKDIKWFNNSTTNQIIRYLDSSIGRRKSS